MDREYSITTDNASNMKAICHAIEDILPSFSKTPEIKFDPNNKCQEMTEYCIGNKELIQEFENSRSCF